ncbi:MAG: helix-turn-helix transcriptional regulator [Bacteroidales bacterium]|nr:helix-turn-helix transcriptional regulator [Bacteroidales bacterium]
MKKIANDNTNSCEPLHEFWNRAGFILCTAGEADLRINNNFYHLVRGSVFIVTPLVQVHEINPSPDFERLSFGNELKVFYPLFKLIADTGIPLKVGQSPCWQLSPVEFLFVKSQYQRIEDKSGKIATSTSAEEQLILTNLINLICVETMLEVVSNHIGKFEVPIDSTRYSNVAYRFILALHENYRTQRSVSWYASQANMSTGHFSTIIREATGQSPSEWVSTVTTTYAKLILEQTDKSIKEIANELNFPEQFTFRKYFKRYAGMSPSDYRKQSR